MAGEYMQGDHDNAVAVPFTDDEAEKPEDLDDDAPDVTPQERLTRRQKQRERITRLLNEGKQNASRVKELEERDAKRDRELAELRGMVAANNNALARQAQPQTDPYEERLNAVYSRQGEAYNAAQAEIKAGTFSAERQKHWEQVARDIETEKSRIHTERALEQSRAQQRQDQARMVWEQKYPEVYRDPRAFQYAQATWQRRKALGEAESNDLADEVFRETMTQFKLGAKPAPSASDKARLSGLPSAGSGGGKAAPVAESNPAFRRMAIAAYPDLSEAEAVKKWSNTTGKKLRDKKLA